VEEEAAVDPKESSEDVVLEAPRQDPSEDPVQEEPGEDPMSEPENQGNVPELTPAEVMNLKMKRRMMKKAIMKKKKVNLKEC
jgi:hypothetical protein